MTLTTKYFSVVWLMETYKLKHETFKLILIKDVKCDWILLGLFAVNDI